MSFGKQDRWPWGTEGFDPISLAKEADAVEQVRAAQGELLQEGLIWRERGQRHAPLSMPLGN
ncbi:MAG: hypothetical protein ABFD16_18635 [Thermoguttaceae bacterium]